MVISGMRAGRSKTNRVISVGSTSGTINSVSQTRPDQGNKITMRSGREITRGVVINDGNGRPSKRRRTQRDMVLAPKRGNNRQRGGTSFGESEEEEEEEASDNHYSTKRSILFWLVDSGVVPSDAYVFYRSTDCTWTKNTGKITKDGLYCTCCKKVVTMSEFEKHAKSTLNDPYRNIFTGKHVNLLNYQIAAWNKQGKSDESILDGYKEIKVKNELDTNDDTCGICGDGGILLCCEGCPSTYHQSCMKIEVVPPGPWICPHCKCKFCNTFQDSLLTCKQCERKFHEFCTRDSDVNLICTNRFFFCGDNCKHIFKELNDMIGSSRLLENGLSWSLNHRLDDISKEGIYRQTRRVTCNSKLAVALQVFEECFDPIYDPRTGFNMIRGVVYNIGSNLNRFNYRGFYTAILEERDEIICAASIRIHGTKLAEMPYIGTRSIYRCQGKCHTLLDAIENTLCRLGVQKLIIPSVEERLQSWVVGHKFQQIDDKLREEMKSMNLVTFPGTIMLQKTLIADSGATHLPGSLNLKLLPPADGQEDNQA
ncbi:ribosomal 40S subunit protein S18B [Ranunculus cassubicifolius]